MEIVKPIAILSQEMQEPVIGWRCSICFNPAQVFMAGETLCVHHAKRWKHGYGETIKDMREEYEHQSR